MDSVSGYAPAKINLNLNVLPVREDGFHSIESIFLSVGLADSITVSRIPHEKNAVRIDCAGLHLPKENTFTKAYNAFCRLTGRGDAFLVTVQKRIPAGGGLGGGSSDAAFFIRAMDALCGTRLGMADFDEIAASVGSDVFFFLRCDFPFAAVPYAAIVTGRGECVTDIRCRPLNIILLLPQVHSSTAEAYQLADAAHRAGHRTTCPPLTELPEELARPASQWHFANSFTTVLCRKYPAIADALSALRECRADFADMSGSGSAVFGIFEDSASFADACARLQKEWGSACVVCKADESGQQSG